MRLVVPVGGRRSTLLTLGKAHVKGHTRHVGDKVVSVRPYETSRPETVHVSANVVRESGSSYGDDGRSTDVLFETRTPGGWTVRLERQRWEHIVKDHTELLEQVGAIERILRDPDEVRVKGHSNSEGGILNPEFDPNHLHFYGRIGARMLILVATRRENGTGFVITAFAPESQSMIDGEVVYKRGEVPWQL